MTLPELAMILETTIDYLLSGKKEEAPIAKFVEPEKRKQADELILRIVVDSGDGDRVRVNLPIMLLRALNFGGDSLENMNINMGGVNMSGFNIDWSQIMMLIENGVMGTLVEVDSEDGDHIEIRVE